MSKDLRTGWLRELKIGDKVFIDRSYYGNKSYERIIIKRITETGRIIANNIPGKNENRLVEYKFNCFGSMMGLDRRVEWNIPTLIQLSESELKAYKELKECERIRNFIRQSDLTKLNIEQLRSIKNIMTLEEEKK